MITHHAIAITNILITNDNTSKLIPKQGNTIKAYNKIIIINTCAVSVIQCEPFP